MEQTLNKNYILKLVRIFKLHKLIACISILVDNKILYLFFHVVIKHTLALNVMIIKKSILIKKLNKESAQNV